VTGVRSAPLVPGKEILMSDEPTMPSNAAPRSRRPRAAVPTVASTPPAPPAVVFSRGAVGGIRAQDVHVRNGVVGGLKGETASVEIGLVGGIAAREANVSQGIVRAVVAQEVRVEQSLVRVIVANRVQAGPSTAIAFVVARQVDGNARILFDWRGALALAAVFGALAAAFRLRRR
jgi:hypothetical protein